MAQILDGTSGHVNHAPLSYDQTAALGRHLQEQIDKIVIGQDTLRNELMGNNDIVEMQKVLTKITTRLQQTEQEAMNATAGVDATKKELGVTNIVMNKIKQDKLETNEMIFSLRKGYKILRMDLQKAVQDITQNTVVADALKEALEKKVIPELQRQDNEIKNAGLGYTRLQAESDNHKKDIANSREDVKDLDVKQQRMRSDTDKLLKVVAMWDSRFETLAKSLQETRHMLESSKAITARLDEDHESTKAQMAELQVGLQKFSTDLRNVRDATSRNASSMQGLQSEIVNTKGIVDHTRENVDSARSDIEHIKNSMDNLGTKHKSLARTIEELQTLAHDTKKGLKDTNSLVLPNLQMDNNGNGFSGGASRGGSKPASPRHQISPLGTSGKSYRTRSPP